MPAAEIGNFSSPPITSDPPDHQDHRRALLPAFSPKAIEKWIPITRDICNELIDQFIDNGSCDASADYAQHIPVKVIARMIGIPKRMRSSEWVHDLRSWACGAVAQRATKDVFSISTIGGRGQTLVTILSRIFSVQVDGEKMDDGQILGGLFLLLLGIDTTWSSIGSSLWHLGQHPEDRLRLCKMIRHLTPLLKSFCGLFACHMARVVTQGEVSGTTLCPGQRVLLPFASANRDTEFMADAETFKSIEK